MFRFVVLLAIIAAAAAAGLAPGATPLLGRLIPQPALAPADTEHAGYVSGLTPVISYAAGYSDLYPALYSAGNIPLPYASNYAAYVAPIEASSYRISY